MRTIRFSLLSILVAGLAIGFPSAALGASAVPTLKSLVSIAGARADGRGSLIIAGELPGSASLPAEIVIPIPKGATIGWVGEIVGSDPSKDPTATYSVSRGKAYDVLTLTVRTARIGQAELVVPLVASGGDITFSQNMPILGQVGLATLSFEVPPGTTVASASASLVRGASSGGERYTLTKKSPRTGTKLTARLVVRSAAPGSASSSPSGTGTQAGPAPGGSGGSSAVASGSGINPFVAMALAAVIGFAGVAAWRYASDRFRSIEQAADGVIETASKSPVPGPASSSAVAQKPVRSRRSGRGGVAKTATEGGTEGDAQTDAQDVVEDVTEHAGDDSTGSSPAPTEPEAAAVQTPVEPGERHPDRSVRAAVPADHADDDVVAQVKQAAALKTEGRLDAEEYAFAKGRLLAGDVEVIGRLRRIATLRTTGLLDDAEFSVSKEAALRGNAGGVLQIEDLAALKASGGLTMEEFAVAKQSVLSGDERVLPLLQELVGWTSGGLLSEHECSVAKEHVLTGSADVISRIEELVELKAEDLLTKQEFQTIVDRLLDA